MVLIFTYFVFIVTSHVYKTTAQRMHCDFLGTINEMTPLFSVLMNRLHDKVQWGDSGQDHIILFKAEICVQYFFKYKLRTMKFENKYLRVKSAELKTWRKEKALWTLAHSGDERIIYNVLHFCNEENLKKSKFQRYILISIKSNVLLDRATVREAKAVDKTEWTVKIYVGTLQIQKRVGEACFSLHSDFNHTTWKIQHEWRTRNGQCTDKLLSLRPLKRWSETVTGHLA
jgi:uncharacterized protein (UPF0333 family)